MSKVARQDLPSRICVLRTTPIRQPNETPRLGAPAHQPYFWTKPVDRAARAGYLAEVSPTWTIRRRVMPFKCERYAMAARFVSNMSRALLLVIEVTGKAGHGERRNAVAEIRIDDQIEVPDARDC